MYSYFNLRHAWNGFDLVELQINCVQINHAQRVPLDLSSLDPTTCLY